jgi:hypothetical protein
VSAGDTPGETLTLRTLAEVTRLSDGHSTNAVEAVACLERGE